MALCPRPQQHAPVLHAGELPKSDRPAELTAADLDTARRCLAAVAPADCHGYLRIRAAVGAGGRSVDESAAADLGRERVVRLERETLGRGPALEPAAAFSLAPEPPAASESPSTCATPCGTAPRDTAGRLRYLLDTLVMWRDMGGQYDDGLYAMDLAVCVISAVVAEGRSVAKVAAVTVSFAAGCSSCCSAGDVTVVRAAAQSNLVSYRAGDIPCPASGIRRHHRRTLSTDPRDVAVDDLRVAGIEA